MGVRTRSGSDGVSVAVGRQIARGMPVKRDGRPITSESASLMVVDDGVLTDAFEILFHPGFGTLTFTLEAVVSSSSILVEGYDIDGKAISETLDTAANVVNTTSERYVSDPAPVVTPKGFTNETVDVTANTEAGFVPGMVNRAYPVSNLDQNEQADTVESNLITARGGFTEDEIGQYFGSVDFTTGVLLEDMSHLLRGMFNPSSLVSIAVDKRTVADVSVPANGEVSDALPESGFEHPSKVKISFAAAPVSGILTLEGFVKIGAKSTNRRYRKETITLGSVKDYESDHYYVSDGMKITVADVGTAGKADFVWDSELYETVLEISASDPEFAGFTVQGLVGGVPVVAKDFVPSEMTLEASSTGITLQLVGPASEVTYHRTVAGGDREVLVPDKAYTSVSVRRYAGWSGAFSFSGETVKATGVTINFNRNYEADDAFDADRFKTDLTAGVKRITVTPTTRFRSGDSANDVFVRWQEVFRDQMRTALSFAMYSYERTGQRTLFRLDFPSCQLNESPQTVVSGAGPIDQPLSFLGLLNSANESPMKITIYSVSAYEE